MHTPVRTKRSAGNGTRKGCGNCLSNGHTHAFGNVLEGLVWENAGARERGRASDPPFCHKTGKGWVAPPPRILRRRDPRQAQRV